MQYATDSILATDRNAFVISHTSQIPAQLLLPLNRLEQTLEVSRSESLKVVPLDDLDEHGRPIHQRLGEQLQQIPALVKINQNVQLLNRLKRLLQFQACRLQSLTHVVIVRLRHRNELDAPRTKIRDGIDDVGRSKRDVLDSRTVVEVDVLLNLALLLAKSGLVDWHLDDIIRRSHDDGLESGVVGSNIVVVDAPKAMETEAPLVILARRIHLLPILVPDAVIDRFQLHRRQELVDWISARGRQIRSTETRQERTRIPIPLNERMRRVSISPNTRHTHRASIFGLIALDMRLPHDRCTPFHRPGKHSFHIVHLKRHIFNSISMPIQMRVHLIQQLLLRGRDIPHLRLRTRTPDWGGKNEADVGVLHDVRGDEAGPGFEAFVCERRESHAGDVVLGCLFGVADPPGYVVVAAVGGLVV